jgi:hypothetical protein
LLLDYFGKCKWRVNDIFWGRGGNPGRLLGVLATNITADLIDFREQSGVYVLYASYSIVYVGQAGNGNQKLFDRLKQHKRDALAERWNQFSWFGTRWVKKSGELSAESEGAHSTRGAVLNHIEAILIHACEPKQNRQGGRFGDQVEQYLQRRDEHAGPTAEEMLYDIWQATKAQ